MGNESNALIVIESEGTAIELIDSQGKLMPMLIANSGPAATFAWEEFIYGKIRNLHTRDAYERAVHRFMKHCDNLNRELRNITPADIGCYLDSFDVKTVTKKLHLSALRHFFDRLVRRHVIPLNPARSVRTERLQIIEGKTPEISSKQARQLLDSIDVSTIVGLRDRAIIGILIFTAARVGAVAKLWLRDFSDLGDQHCLEFEEKGGKPRSIPVRHDLQKFIKTYIENAGFSALDKRLPLFRTTLRRTKELTQNGMTANDMNRMMKRRLKAAGLSSRFSPHSFRVATITDLLSQGVPLEDVQTLAGHADPRTTRLYDRRDKTITRNIVERISI